MLRRAKERPRESASIEGIHIAAITPRREREVEVDLGAMLELMDFLGTFPVQGIGLFGTTGEFIHFTLEERSRYVALLSKRSRVPVLTNVSHSTLDGAITMAEEAAGAGISAVLVMAPYYFLYPASAVEAFLIQFAEHVAKWVRVFLYNIPMFSHPLTLQSLDRLISTGLFAGIKDSSGDWGMMAHCLALKESRPFTVLAGNDGIYTRARRSGADGAVSGVACAVPELMLAIERAVQAGRVETAERLDARLKEFITRIDEFPVPVGIKAAVSARGIKAGPPASPLGPDGDARIERFRGWFREWLVDVQRDCKEPLD